MKNITLIFLLLIARYAFTQDSIIPDIIAHFTAEGLEILEEAEGDLDRDSIPERVIICNTIDTGELGIIRELQVYKKKNGGWIIWKRTRNAVLESEAGGMMGDPLESLKIENGILQVSFYGGSSWKWGYSDKYRFQNGQFELVGYTGLHGKYCEEWTAIDFNLSTGKIIAEKETETCENTLSHSNQVIKTETETFYLKGIYITLDNRLDAEVKIVSPKYKLEFYL